MIEPIPIDDQIVALLLEGHNNAAIARLMKMGERTVDVRIEKMYKKHGIVGAGIHRRLKLAVLLCPKPEREK